MKRSLLSAPTRRAILQFAQHKLCPPAMQQQLRNYQSAYNADRKTTLIDSLSLVYEDTKYPLDCRPWEYRDGQLQTYNLFGAVAATIPGLWVIFVAMVSWFWYTISDTEVVHGWMKDNHPFFNVHSGADLKRHPIFHVQLMFSPLKLSPDRHFFYQEIDQAIKTRRAEKNAK